MLEVEQAKSPAITTIFTNCGKADDKKGPVISAKHHKLTRVPFTVSRLMEFCTHRELVNQTGHDVHEWPLVVLKELIDNALDAAEEAEIAPAISIAVQGDAISVEDNGPGIPAKTIEGVLDYSIRVSSREAYVSPTRGAQGNALKTIMPMGYVLTSHRGENAVGKTIIETRGIAHQITFDVDHIRQQPKIEHLTAKSTVVAGTKITVELPYDDKGDYGYWNAISDDTKILKLCESYAWLNPHLTLRVVWNGEVKIDIEASDPTWTKWLPSWPTSAHWYDESRFRRYMAAHVAHRDNITVREFISELRGLKGTAKQKQVLAEVGASHVTLYDFFGRQKVKTENIAALLASVKRHSKPVRPADLGIIGKKHLYARMEFAGGDPRTFTYNRELVETNSGLPTVTEFAFGIHRDGLDDDGPAGKIITGVNWSPGIKNPFRQIGRDGEGLDGVLAKARADGNRPVIMALHLACPRVAYTDRGKSAIVVED